MAGISHGEKTYLGILEPEEGRAGVWTVYDPKTEKLPNKLRSFAGKGGAESPSNYTAQGDSFTQRQLSAVMPDEATIPDSSPVRKALIPTIATGSVLMPSPVEAAPYQFPADKRGTVLYEKGLESPIVDPVDILLAPIGAVGTGAKAAAMAAEPVVSYGVDKALDYISRLWGE